MPEDQIPPDEDDELIFRPEDIANDKSDTEGPEAESANEDPFVVEFDSLLSTGAPVDSALDPVTRLLGAVDGTDDIDDDPFADLGRLEGHERRTVSYNFYGCAKPSDHPEFEILERWVRWLVWHFELGDVVPPCWADHDAIAEEMAALYEGWNGIYAASGTSHHPLDQLTWLGHLDSSLSRVATKWDRANCGSRGQHDAESSLRSVWPDMAEAEGPYREASDEPLTSVGAGTDDGV